MEECVMGFKAPINALGSQASSMGKRTPDREGRQLNAVILLPHRGNLRISLRQLLKITVGFSTLL
jgi:hypothetical protein